MECEVDDLPWTENELQQWLQQLIEEASGGNLPVVTFGEAGVMTTNKGLVVRIPGRIAELQGRKPEGREYQITIVRSR